MTDLNEQIRMKVAATRHNAQKRGIDADEERDPRLTQLAADTEDLATALLAALDEHQQAYSLVYDVPRRPSGEPRRELHPWCVCQEHDAMADDGREPCPTKRAIAKELGIEVDSG